MMRRYRSSSIEVTVDIDDVIHAIDNDDLVDELRRRSKTGQPIPDVEVERIYDALRAKDYDDALLICRQLLQPKWKSAQEATAALEKARAA